MAITQDNRNEKLRDRAALIHAAVEAYLHGESKNTNEIAKQCHILQYEAESPEVFAERLRYQPLTVCALMIAIEGGMLQALSNNGRKDLTADQVAELTQRPKIHITRALRLLTAVGVCDEVGPQKYRANDKTAVMASKGQIGGLRVSSVPIAAITTKIEEYFSQYTEAAPEENVLQSAYAYTFGKSMYEVFKENKERKSDFDAYMQARKKEKSRTWHATYPVMSQLSAYGTAVDTSKLTIVDVGGNRGHDLESFAASTPEYHGRLVLQDLPETVAPLIGEKHVFEPMAYDFFTPQPVKGARLYLLLACLHNWDDNSCRSILRNIAGAMQRGYSRLLISGMLLPDMNAERRQAELDIQMWMLQLTRQRTESELVKLVNDVGLEIVKVWENGDRESIIEVQLQED